MFINRKKFRSKSAEDVSKSQLTAEVNEDANIAKVLGQRLQYLPSFLPQSPLVVTQTIRRLFTIEFVKITLVAGENEGRYMKGVDRILCIP